MTITRKGFSAGRTITYNYDNMPVNVSGNTFVYDYAGQRVKKNSTIYIGKLYECTGGSCIKYIFAGSNRIAMKTSSSTYFYHTDHLGSSSVMTGENGAGQGEYHYYPYGKTRISSGLGINHRFTGQELDGETGLYYYGARYYEPNIGRFISADSIVQDYADPQTLNRYSYCRNNPIIYTDPSGHLFLIDDILIGAAIGAIIGGATSAVTGGDIWQGMAMGAIGGAFMGAAAGYGVVAEIGAGVASGGVNSAIVGGDIGQGMLYGGIGAAAGYGLGAAIKGVGNENFQFGARIAGGGLISGGIAEMTGGKFSEGFASGAVGAAMGYGIGRLVGNKEQTPAEQEEKAIMDLTVNHSDISTSTEWQQLAMGQSASSASQVASDTDYLSDIPPGYIPARRAIPGELGTIILRDTSKVGLEFFKGYRRAADTISKLLQYKTAPIMVPNPNILNPPVPDGFSDRTRIR